MTHASNHLTRHCNQHHLIFYIPSSLSNIDLLCHLVLLTMRVPLEILRIILDHLVQLCSDRMSLTQLAEANETSTYHAIRIVRSLLLRLRLVNSTFLSLLITNAP